jgi:hypothetical protein
MVTATAGEIRTDPRWFFWSDNTAPDVRISICKAPHKTTNYWINRLQQNENNARPSILSCALGAI